MTRTKMTSEYLDIFQYLYMTNLNCPKKIDKLECEKNIETAYKKLQFDIVRYGGLYPVLAKSMSERTFSDTLIAIKYTWIGIIDDLVTEDFTMNIFNKNSRVFYIITTFNIIGILILILNACYKYYK